MAYDGNSDTEVLPSIRTPETGIIVKKSREALSKENDTPDLGALARIHIAGRTPPRTMALKTLEFLFLEKGNWSKFSIATGKIIPLLPEELAYISNPSNYLLIGPIDMDAKRKDGKREPYEFELYQKANSSNLYG